MMRFLEKRGANSAARTRWGFTANFFAGLFDLVNRMRQIFPRRVPAGEIGR
jgi:hypothetical protein